MSLLPGLLSLVPGLSGHSPLSHSVQTEETSSKNTVPAGPISEQLQNVRSKLPSAEASAGSSTRTLDGKVSFEREDGSSVFGSQSSPVSEAVKSASQPAFEAPTALYNDTGTGSGDFAAIGSNDGSATADEMVGLSETTAPEIFPMGDMDFYDFEFAPENDVVTGSSSDSESSSEVLTGLLVDLEPESDSPAESESSDNSSEILPQFELDPPNHKETVQQLKARMQAKVAQRENGVETPKVEAAPTMTQKAVSGHSLALSITTIEGVSSPENETPVFEMFQPYRPKVTSTATAVPQSVSNVRTELLIDIKMESDDAAENTSSDDLLNLASLTHDQKMAIIKARVAAIKRASLGENGAAAPKAETAVPSGANAASAPSAPSAENVSPLSEMPTGPLINPEAESPVSVESPSSAVSAEVLDTLAELRVSTARLETPATESAAAPMAKTRAPSDENTAAETAPARRVPRNPNVKTLKRTSQPVVVSPTPRKKATVQVASRWTPEQLEKRDEYLQGRLKRAQEKASSQSAGNPYTKVTAQINMNLNRGRSAAVPVAETRVTSRQNTAAVTAAPRLRKAQLSVGGTPVDLEFKKNRDRAREGLQLSENFQGMRSSTEVMSPRTLETSKNAMPVEVGQYVVNPLWDEKSMPPPKTESGILPETPLAAGSFERSGPAIETSREVEQPVDDSPSDIDPTLEKKSESKSTMQKAMPGMAGSNHAAGFSAPKQPSIFQFSAAVPHSESSEQPLAPEIPPETRHAAGLSSHTEREVAVSRSVTPYVFTSLWDADTTSENPDAIRLQPETLHAAGVRSDSEQAGTTVSHRRQKSAAPPPSPFNDSLRNYSRSEKGVLSAADKRRAARVQSEHLNPGKVLKDAVTALAYDDYKAGDAKQFLKMGTRPATTKRFVKRRKNVDVQRRVSEEILKKQLIAKPAETLADVKSRIREAMLTGTYATGNTDEKVAAYWRPLGSSGDAIREQLGVKTNPAPAAAPLAHARSATIVAAPKTVAMAALPPTVFASPLENFPAEVSQERPVRVARRRSQARPEQRPSTESKAPQDAAQDTPRIWKRAKQGGQKQVKAYNPKTLPTLLQRWDSVASTAPARARMSIAPNRPPLMTPPPKTLPTAALPARPARAPATPQARASRWVQNDRGGWEKKTGTSAPQPKPVELTVNRRQHSQISDALERPQREQRPHAWDHAGWLALAADRSQSAPYQVNRFEMADATVDRLADAKTDQALLGEWDNYVASTAAMAGVEGTRLLSVDNLTRIWEQRARNGK
jgi:hypothetical protein